MPYLLHSTMLPNMLRRSFLDSTKLSDPLLWDIFKRIFFLWQGSRLACASYPRDLKTRVHFSCFPQKKMSLLNIKTVPLARRIVLGVPLAGFSKT